MPTTNFGSAIKTGTGLGDGADSGFNVLSQSKVLSFDATLVQSTTFVVPKNSQLVDFRIDVLTAYDSATSATLSIGTAAAGTQYVGSVNAKTTGRAAPTLSAAQLAAMANVGTNLNVVATVTSVGQPTAGSVRVTMTYVQTE